MQFRIVSGYKGRPELYPVEGHEAWKEAALQVPQIRIEVDPRFGKEVSSSWYPLLPRDTASVGDIVEIDSLYKVIDVPKAPPHARKMVVVNYKVIKTAQAIEAENRLAEELEADRLYIRLAEQSAEKAQVNKKLPTLLAAMRNSNFSHLVRREIELIGVPLLQLYASDFGKGQKLKWDEVWAELHAGGPLIGDARPGLAALSAALDPRPEVQKKANLRNIPKHWLL